MARDDIEEFVHPPLRVTLVDCMENAQLGIDS